MGEKNETSSNGFTSTDCSRSCSCLVCSSLALKHERLDRGVMVQVGEIYV